jgi:hypothetical protein
MAGAQAFRDRQDFYQAGAQLADLEQRVMRAPNSNSSTPYPSPGSNWTGSPEDWSAPCSKPLRLGIRYNRDTDTVTCRVTLTGPTITAASRTAHDAAVISLEQARQQREQRKKD